MIYGGIKLFSTKKLRQFCRKVKIASTHVLTNIKYYNKSVRPFCSSITAFASDDDTSA